MLMPVTFAPGRFRLATSPVLTGSIPTTKTMGIVDATTLWHLDAAEWAPSTASEAARPNEPTSSAMSAFQN